MSWDLAIDPNTGDLKIAPNNDIGVRTGSEVVEQRIRVRLRIHAGQWHLDPTGGGLGSHLRELTRLPLAMARDDAPRMVREALEPMEDIHVGRVVADIDPKDGRKLNVQLVYSLIEPSGVNGEEQTLTTSVQIGE